ncbi:hypothetical protein E2C01_057417 [Portunus trituberculatus]|uniref:Uncharacterized protein n=1 Tax=Portunus trituberculatus TaxID=210409 RepID=A0A5B7H0A0_PORTR|nr:hypothetical protein [Portunus trituberculatus]
MTGLLFGDDLFQATRQIEEAGRLKITKKKEKIRVVARVVGFLVAAIPAVEMRKLHYRRMERAKIKTLEKACGDFNGWMDITDEIRTDLNW